MDSVDQINLSIDSMNVNIDKLSTSSEVKFLLEVEGLKISKRNLYDQNFIIRTSIRPDDRMNEYDHEIKLLEEKYENK